MQLNVTDDGELTRITLAFLVFGAAFLWFGLNTPIWWEFSIVGAMGLVVGFSLLISLTKSTLHSIRLRTILPQKTPQPPATVEMGRSRCSYCGTLATDSKLNHCTSCGAPV